MCTILNFLCHTKAIARAIYSRRKYVLLDDIFDGMDARTGDIVASRLIGRDGLLRKQHATVVLVTHSRMCSSHDIGVHPCTTS